MPEWQPRSSSVRVDVGLFSLLFALHGVFVDKGSSRDKFWMVLPSPVAGIVISMVLFAIFFGVAFLLAFGRSRFLLD
jgi:hypothetical protein